ncbi:MAG TPA: PAS domain S-box protein [Pedobacter sp.]|jgi:PAS domain S-box-containing protein
MKEENLITERDATGVKDQNFLAKELLNDLPVAVYSCNAKGYITGYNKAAVALWGRSPEIGKDLFNGSNKIYYPNGEIMSPENYPITRTLKTGVAVEGEEIIIERADGKKVNVLPMPVPQFDENGLIIGAVNTLIDASKHARAFEKQAILAAIIDTSDDAIISKTLKGIITSWNKSAESLFGYTEQEVVGKHISIIFPPERIQEEDIIISNIAQGKKVEHFETIRVAKDGHRIPISVSVSPVKDSRGNIIGASKIARDLTFAKEADERRAVLAAIVDTSDDAIINKTLDGIITSWNKSAERTFGYTPEEAIGKHISLLIPEDRLSEEDFIIGNVSKGNKIDHFETIRKAKDGSSIPISLSVSPIKDNKGNIIGASKIATDVSALKRALEESERNAANLRIINTLGKEIAEDLHIETILQKVTDATTKLTNAEFGAFFYNTHNQEGEAYMLYTLAGAPREAFDKFGMPRNTDVFHTTFSGKGIVRVDDITKDPRYGKSAPHHGMPRGHLPVVSYLAVPVRGSSGEVIGGLFYGHPEPARFTQEHEDLVLAIASQASNALANGKLYNQVVSLNAKKDEFIGMASHELKTPLTSISGYMQILDRINSDEKSRQFISKTVQQVKKLSALVNDLLDVSKIEAGKLQLIKREFDLIKVTTDVVELIRNSQASHTIKFVSNVQSIVVNADPNRIEQLIINLLTNAVKYSPAANQVDIIIQSSNQEVTVGVKDTGLGIEADKLKHIFSRFYRVDGLNPTISGLGIGLYICKEIVDRHGGKIWVDSKYGKGSTFWFKLPIT